MSKKEIHLDVARKAKEKARVIFPKLGQVTGVGLTQRKGKFFIKVNLEEEPLPNTELPESIDGVPVLIQVTGKIRKQAFGEIKNP